MGAIVLLIAAFIFIVDAAFMFGKVEAKGAAVANAVIGSMMGVLGLLISFSAKDSGTLAVAGLTMAFSMFYLILAWSLFGGHDLKSLGYYCLGAGAFVGLCAYFFFRGGDLRFGWFSVGWSVLFLSAFGSLSLGKPWGKFIGGLLAVESVVTLLVPAFMMIAGTW